MNIIKTKEEIEIIREGGKILANILNEAVKMVCPGITTGELEDFVCRKIKEIGGRPSFKGYNMSDNADFPTALCASINNEVVHAPAYPSRILKEGDIISLDIGMEYPLSGKNNKNKYSKLGGFYTDMARTVAVGNIDDKVQKLINTTRRSLELGIQQIKPGNTLSDVGWAIQQYAESQGFSVVKELVGHGVGYDVHEEPQVPNYKITDNSLENVVLKPGMVIAIEPMVNMGTWRVDVGDDEFTIVTADGGLSAHFEDTIAVTSNGYKVLTAL